MPKHRWRTFRPKSPMANAPPRLPTAERTTTDAERSEADGNYSVTGAVGLGDSPPFDALPTIVVGRRLPPNAALRTVVALPPAMIHWEHQYGGLACLQATLIGVALPLRSVRTANADSPKVLEGLAALGDDSPDGASASFPELGGLHLTHGDRLESGAIDALASFLSRGFKMPRPARGHEALVELAQCDLVAAFGGWPLWQPKQTVWRETFDPACLERLIEWLSHALPEAAPPKAYLVWRNSD